MFERLTALLWKPRSDTVRTGSVPVMDRVTMVAANVLTLPTRRDDVEDWVAPPAREVPAKTHAEALISLFQTEGRTGPVPHWQLTSSYPELAWMQGFYELSERELLHALGQVCAKVRPWTDRGDGVMGKVTCYVIPQPSWAKATDTMADSVHSKSAPKGIVVPIGNTAGKTRQARAKRARTGMRVVNSSGIPMGSKGARHRADIVSAVA